MDSNSRYQVQQPNSGLLRFRSAPVLANFKQDQAVNNGNPWEGSPRSREFVKNKVPAAKESSSPLSRMSVLPLPPRHDSSVTSDIMLGSMGMDQSTHKSFSSHLLRQSTFPNNISFQNGYDAMIGVGNYGRVNGNDGEPSLSMNRMKSQVSFSSRSSSSLGMLSSNSKMGNEGVRINSPHEDGRHEGSSNGDARYFGHGFPYASWDENSHLKRKRHSNDELLSDEAQNHARTLSHHLSLSRTSSEMFAMDNLLQFTDSVPCKIRAKRGFATHPRSIAERVRRTRISERIRKLQELVPNMEKQTSTAEMLDLAVEYIKDLQKQFKTLSERRAKCQCIKVQKSEANQVV